VRPSRQNVRGSKGAELMGMHPAWRARNLGGAKPQGGNRLGFWLNPNYPCAGSLERAKPWGDGTGVFAGIQSREGHGAREGVRRFRGRKASKGKPQEWNWDEISPAGHEGSKASKG
jgi:hypothetical protein